MVSLAQRRKYLYVNFVYNLLNDNIENSGISGALLILNVPTFNFINYFYCKLV